jgi:hypothetical protein
MFQSLFGKTTTLFEATTPPPPPPKPMKVVYNPPDPLAGLNGLDSYITYNNLQLNDGTNLQDLTNNGLDCVNKCIKNPNCKGLNILQNTGQQEVTSDGYNYEQTPSVTCEYVSNIAYSNSKVENENSTFYAKKNNLAFEKNTPYLLNTGNECLSVQKNKDGSLNLKGISCNDYDNLTPVYFNTDSDTIKVGEEGNNCLKYYNASAMDNNSLQKCNDFDNSQKFIYDHVFKTLRPFNDTSKCLYRDSNGTYVISDCAINDLAVNKTTTFENYYKPGKDDFIEYFQQDYSVNMGYYIIYMILLLMICYLVIISSKNK